MTNTFARIPLLLLISSTFLLGCEQKQPNQALPSQTAIKKYQQPTTLHGNVANAKGLAEKGTIKASTTSGQVIVSTVLENGKSYSIEIPADTALPILLTFSPENSQSEDENYVSVVIHPTITKYDINPLTTAIAKKAMTLGGYTDSNMRQAAESMISVPDADKTSTGFRGDPTQHYGGWH